MSDNSRITLKELRARHGWTQGQLAARLGVSSAGVVSRWEMGVHRPTPLAIDRLEAILGLPIEAIDLVSARYRPAP